MMTREDLTAWFFEHGYLGAQPGNYITARAQEQLLESVFVIVQAFRSDPTIGASPTHARPGPIHDVPRPGAADLNWSQLDQFNVPPPSSWQTAGVSGFGGNCLG